jgi:hypothetical protein
MQNFVNFFGTHIFAWEIHVSNDTVVVSVIAGIFWEGFGHLCWPVRHFEQNQVLHQHGEYLFKCIKCV